MNELIVNQLFCRLCELGKSMGFSEPIIRSNKYSTEIYIVDKHALQVEIDWKENNLFMYAVYLIDCKLPDDSVIYHYPNGHWCRKYLEEICSTKRPSPRNSDRRYSFDYLLDCFNFYASLIGTNPELVKFLKTGD